MGSNQIFGNVFRNCSIPSNILYKLFLVTFKKNSFKPDLTDFDLKNCALKEDKEYIKAINELERIGLSSHRFDQKNWDALAALDMILKNTDKSARILDAGGEVYSPLVDWLFMYDYTNLEVANIAFDKSFKRGPINFKPIDITSTPYPDNYFDAVTSLSVIEHGVDINRFFDEMHRVIKPGGKLIISTDYWIDEIDTTGKYAFNCPVKIFHKKNIEEMVDYVVSSNMFSLDDDIDYECKDKVVYWKEVDLDYTFIVFSMTNK